MDNLSDISSLASDFGGLVFTDEVDVDNNEQIKEDDEQIKEDDELVKEDSELVKEVKFQINDDHEEVKEDIIQVKDNDFVNLESNNTFEKEDQFSDTRDIIQEELCAVDNTTFDKSEDKENDEQTKEKSVDTCLVDLDEGKVSPKRIEFNLTGLDIKQTDNDDEDDSQKQETSDNTKYRKTPYKKKKIVPTTPLRRSGRLASKKQQPLFPTDNHS